MAWSQPQPLNSSSPRLASPFDRSNSRPPPPPIRTNSVSSVSSYASSRSSYLKPTPTQSPYQDSPSSAIRAANFPEKLARSPSNASLNSGTPYANSARNSLQSLSSTYSLPADPQTWGVLLSVGREDDDDLHNPMTPKGSAFVGQPGKNRIRGTVLTGRGFSNLGCLIILVVGLITLFAGFPIASFATRHPLSTLGGFNIGGTNATGQIPVLAGSWGLIDADTPDSAKTITSFNDDGAEYQLVFSDEFNTDGRSFYPGDDPYWEAVDLHYFQTGDLEWYDPSAVTTAGGALQITLSQQQTHGLDYQGGMVSTWNKFCFTGGLIVTSVTLPGISNVLGFWPAVWTMGNLGRAGYGASLEGMWPYTYDSCDVGTAPNQTIGGLPIAATVNGDPANFNELSYLPGQRLSRCTCPGESHPGPVHADGTFVGRSSPEIDIFEAQGPIVSQSGQWAPFDESYNWLNTTDNQIIYDPSITVHNTFKGGVFQETTSCTTKTNTACYELSEGCFAVYGFEYKPGFDGAYISWISDNQLAWTLNSGGVGPNAPTEISARPISQEPMYIIANLGISPSFGFIDFEHLVFPATLSIDYIRVYQPTDAVNIGCSPPDFPTAAYIETYIEAYTNPNLTTWVDDFGQPFPKNSLLETC